MEHGPPGSDPQVAYLRMLAGPPGPGRFFDVRWRSPHAPMCRRFLATAAVRDAARLITRMAVSGDVYVGVAPRSGRSHGGRAAVERSHLAWVESDDSSTAARLLSFSYPPTMIIASGTPGHLQLYWRLSRAFPIAEVEVANRRLALALAGDTGCADGARILRPPGTLNHKHNPPRPVVLQVFRADVSCTLAQLLHGLPESAGPVVAEARLSGRRTGRTRVDRELLSIPAAEYVRVLTGLAANREGKILCPFHSDRDPSLQLYPDGGFYCFGSGCRRGGTIFDFAGHLWEISPKGAGFLELRRRLAQRFALTAAPLREGRHGEHPDARSSARSLTRG
jgi:hypothetical protein